MTPRNHLRLVEPLPDPKPIVVEPGELSPCPDIRDLQPAFERFLARQGVPVNYRSEQSRKMATALLALTATMSGTDLEMPQSVFEEFDRIRSSIGVRSVTEDRTVYREARTGGA